MDHKWKKFYERFVENRNQTQWRDLRAEINQVKCVALYAQIHLINASINLNIRTGTGLIKQIVATAPIQIQTEPNRK